MNDGENIAYAIGVDLGGTRIKAVLLDVGKGVVVNRLTCDSLGSEFEGWKIKIKEMVVDLQTGLDSPIMGIGLAAPGIAASNRQSIALMPGRLSGLEGFQWSSYLDRSVTVINDAQSALLAEVYYGQLKGVTDGFLLTLGTGVGGALWLNNQLYGGKHHFAGHLGHLSIDANSVDRGITSMPGSLEAAIGNESVVKRSCHRYQNTKELVVAYEKQEPLASYVWLNSVRQLAIGLASLINVFAPEKIVLSGGIANAGESLFQPLNAFMNCYEWCPMGENVPIVKAEFEEWSGAIGAAVAVIECNN